ncbi:MAG: diguanylate cyclase and metal dependent [Erysipelotrichaceae bacterium]|nr:MAG: diguanylate cyclase and metal dependent [Erysipelotrichaceae bacterium]
MKMLFEKNSREMLRSARVGKICESIAKKMNLSQEVIESIKMTGMLHDIGKIGVDELILNKRGKLDEREWKEVKKHTEIGYRILSASSEFIIFADDILKHHERIDGKGYPKGIKGDEISLTAKIISIADTYDALTSDRTYHSASSEEVAIKEIVKSSGTQFDPTIVNVFVNLLREQRI